MSQVGEVVDNSAVLGQAEGFRLESAHYARRVTLRFPRRSGHVACGACES